MVYQQIFLAVVAGFFFVYFFFCFSNVASSAFPFQFRLHLN